MSALRYKDYQGSVTYEDGHLLIQILHIDDFITTECDSASGAQVAFEELVDDYLETCIELGKTPSKPFRGSFNVRVSPELHKAAAMAAANAGESLNALVSRALRNLVDTEKTKREVFSAAFARDFATWLFHHEQTARTQSFAPWQQPLEPMWSDLEIHDFARWDILPRIESSRTQVWNKSAVLLYQPKSRW
jgi:predicted HicB family RNase H-like nuclease